MRPEGSPRLPASHDILLDMVSLYMFARGRSKATCKLRMPNMAGSQMASVTWAEIRSLPKSDRIASLIRQVEGGRHITVCRGSRPLSRGTHIQHHVIIPTATSTDSPFRTHAISM